MLALIFKGARVGGIGLGIYGMVGVFILVFVFGMKPGNLPIDVMLIIVSVITAAAALQAAGGLDYLVGLAAKFLRKHPTHITYFGPLTTWLFCLVAGTAHTCYSLLPIISEIATNSKIRPERPLSVATIAASLGITGSPVSAATAAIISTDLLGGAGIELKDVMMICIPASLIAILVAAFVQNHIGKELVDDEVYKERVAKGIIDPEHDSKLIDEMIKNPNPRAKYAVVAFLLGVLMVVVFGSVPSLRPSFMVGGNLANGHVGMREEIADFLVEKRGDMLVDGGAADVSDKAHEIGRRDNIEHTLVFFVRKLIAARLFCYEFVDKGAFSLEVGRNVDKGGNFLRSDEQEVVGRKVLDFCISVGMELELALTLFYQEELGEESALLHHGIEVGIGRGGGINLDDAAVGCANGEMGSIGAKDIIKMIFCGKFFKIINYLLFHREVLIFS